MDDEERVRFEITCSKCGGVMVVIIEPVSYKQERWEHVWEHCYRCGHHKSYYRDKRFVKGEQHG